VLGAVCVCLENTAFYHLRQGRGTVAGHRAVQDGRFFVALAFQALQAWQHSEMYTYASLPDAFSGICMVIAVIGNWQRLSWLAWWGDISCSTGFVPTLRLVIPCVWTFGSMLLLSGAHSAGMMGPLATQFSTLHMAPLYVSLVVFVYALYATRRAQSAFLFGNTVLQSIALFFASLGGLILSFGVLTVCQGANTILATVFVVLLFYTASITYSRNMVGDTRGSYLMGSTFLVPQNSAITCEYYLYVVSDFMRVMTGEIIYGISKAVGWLANKVTAPGLQYHYQPSFLPKLNGIELGIAFRATPLNPTDEKPSMVSLNIGHMCSLRGDGIHQDSKSSMEQQEIRLANIAMLQSLAEDPEGAQKGFAGAFQAEFFDSKGNIIEYNVSGWRDQEAARTWAMTNTLHKGVTKKFHQKGLETFSSVLMNLGPEGSGIRRVQRCLQCKGVMRNLDATVLQCKHCGADLANQQGFNRKASSLPWF